MANTRSARKMVRKIAVRTERNKARRSRMRTFVRKVEEAVERSDPEAAKAALVRAESEIMRAVSRGVIHRRAGSRKVSRLTRHVRKLD